MNLGGFSFIGIFVALAAAFPNSRAQTNKFVAPLGMETAFGNSRSIPFPGGYPSFHQIYPSNLFAALPADTIIITEMAFRVDENQGVDLNVYVSGLRVFLNVFRGSLGEIIGNASGYQFPQTEVFRKDIQFQARAGLTNAFDVRIPFTKPFIYDRRAGHLVAAFGIGDYSYSIVFDAHASAVQDGFSIFRGGTREPLFEVQVLVTEFTYYFPPQITQVRVGAAEVEITFVFEGLIEQLHLEGSPTVLGPYIQSNNATLSLVRPGEGRASLSVSAGNRFFRIQQNIP